MSELSFKGMLESVKGRTLTDKQCAKVLSRALEELAGMTKDAGEDLALAQQEIEWSLDQLARFYGLANEKPLTPGDQEKYDFVVHELAESRRVEAHTKESLEQTKQRVSKVLHLIDQLVASVMSTQNPK